MDSFSSIQVFTEKTLNTRRLQGVENLLTAKNRGFGFWLWKPAVILSALDVAGENDLVLYADIGCRLNPRGAKRLKDYFDLVMKDPIGILAFQNFPPKESPVWDGRWLPMFPDGQWTKGDLLDHLGVRDKPEITETPSLAAGVILFRNNSRAREFVKKWLEIMVGHVHLIDDSPSISPNHPWFIASRHDQSVFSALGKLEGVKTVSSFEFWYPSVGSFRPDWQALATNPIHARRDLDFGLRMNLLHFVIDKIRGIRFRVKSILKLPERLYRR